MPAASCSRKFQGPLEALYARTVTGVSSPPLSLRSSPPWRTSFRRENFGLGILDWISVEKGKPRNKMFRGFPKKSVGVICRCGGSGVQFESGIFAKDFSKAAPAASVDALKGVEIDGDECGRVFGEEKVDGVGDVGFGG